MTRVNLTDHQGVNAHEHWLSGVLWEVGCSGGADPTGIRLLCSGLKIGVKYLIINYLTLELASTGAGDCGFPHFFYVVPFVTSSPPLHFAARRSIPALL